jgi:hypothetical protein
MRRMAVLCGFLIAVGVFCWHIFTGQGLLYAAFWALAVHMITTALFLGAMKWIGTVLMDHLKDEKKRPRDSRMSRLLRNDSCIAAEGADSRWHPVR